MSASHIQVMDSRRRRSVHGAPGSSSVAQAGTEDGLRISLTVAVVDAYDSPLVALPAREHAVGFTLRGGTHTAISDYLDLGVLRQLGGRRLVGRLTFRYTYDEANRTVTVCGTDFDSADGMCLVTLPEGTTEICRQRAGTAGYGADELRANPHWNYTTPATPGLRDVLAGLVRSANSELIAALEAEGSLIVRVRKNPPEMSPQEHRQFLAVYRNGTFHGFLEPGTVAGPEDEIFTVESVFGGEVTLSYGEAFANVIGSTSDPSIAGLTWIQLWANQFGVYPVICTSYNANGFACGSSLVGGHVVSGKTAVSVPKGSNAVYIFPICVQHNNNNGVYMEAIKYLKGIWLKNYLGT